MNIKRQFILLVALFIMIPAIQVFANGEKEAPDTNTATEINLTYWSMWNETEPQAMVFKDAIKDFMKMNPDVKVDIQWNGREIRKTLQPSLDAGTKIDIWDEDIERIVKSWQKYAISLDGYYAQSYPSTNGKDFRDTIMGSLQEVLKTLSTDEKTYAVPYQPFVVVSFYNKDHFKKAGITSVPTNWAELLEVAKKLKDAGFTPITIDDAYMDLPIGIHLNRMFGDTADVEALVKDRTGKLWDDPRVLQVAKDFEALAPYMSKYVPTNKWPAGQQEVATDQASIYLTNGTWLPNEVMGTTGEDFPWGQFAYPEVTGGANTGGGIFSAQGFQINKECENPDVAFALLAHLTTGKWDRELSQKTYGAPMDTSMPWPKQIVESKVVFNNLTRRLPWSAGLAADPDAFPVIKLEFTSLIAGEISAEKFIENIKSSLK